MPVSPLLYRPHELSFRTQYAELKERSAALEAFLAGAPGSLVKRAGTGYAYWYRVYYPVPGQQAEQLVAKEDDIAALNEMRSRIDLAQWTQAQVRHLRKLDFQVADKSVASVLVELYNRGLLQAGLSLVGTLAYMAWLNELGARANSAQTQDVDLAVPSALKLGAPQSFLDAMTATRLDFSPIPGMPSQSPSTSVKRRGREGLRVDVLADGKALGKAVRIESLGWHASAMPHFDYLLAQPRQAALLAGSHCVPLCVPQAARFMWHKLYTSAARTSFPEKARKDLVQAATLAAVLVEQEDEDLADTFGDAPRDIRSAAKTRLNLLRPLLVAHPMALDRLESAMR